MARVFLALALGLGATMLPQHASRASADVLVPDGIIQPGRPDGASGEAAYAAAGASAGPPIDFAARPEDVRGGTRACSFRLPICVHAQVAVGAGIVEDTIASSERAWELLTGALAFPAPDVDLATGALDVYVVDHVDTLAAAVVERRDDRSAFDRATAFVLLDAHARGCSLDDAIARELARASLWRAAPATDGASARAATAYLARLMVPCSIGMPDGVQRFQAHPEQAIPDPLVDAPALDGEERAQGAALFYWWLDYAFGAEPGAVVRALWALAPTRTPFGALSWAGSPNGVDVLRVSFKGALTTDSTLDDLWVDFGVARAFVGAADDGAHLPESRAIGVAGVVPRQWDIAWPEHPRRLASGPGVAPTGTAYVGISRAGAPRGARLRIEASWEEHAEMRWVVVKVGGAGNEVGRIAIPTRPRATEASMSVVDLDGVASILLVGTNVGDASAPFNPNDGVWEPHGWTLTVASE